jgi:hypothetical protein
MTVEECIALDAKVLKSHLRALKDDLYTGSGQTSRLGSIAFEVLRDCAGFIVRFPSTGQECRLQPTTLFFDPARRRWWFSCLRCGRKCRIVYLPPFQSTVACRKCWGLSYRSQQWSGNVFAPLLRVDRLKQRLGNPDSPLTPSDPLPPRLKHMHKKTYDRCLRQIRDAQEKAIPIFDRWLDRREEQKRKVHEQWQRLQSSRTS